MTFKEFLILKEIPFKDDGESVLVDEEYLLNHEEEIMENFPNFEFLSLFIRHNAYPVRITDDKN